MTAFKEGKYYVVSHVTARGIHAMPWEEVIVENKGSNENTLKVELISRAVR